MLDESLRRRLEALNRGPLPEPPSGVVSSRGAPIRVETKQPIVEPRQVKPLPGLLRRAEIVTADAGEHLKICLPLEELWRRGPHLVSARCQQLAADGLVEDAELAALINAFPDRVLLMDLETCGLAGAALFLIGLLRTIDGELTVELLLARNYAQEQAILKSFWRIAAECDVLVTFNGKAFDWPMVLDRSQRHLLMGVRNSECGLRNKDAELVHVDLLHHARRRWKGELPDCKLQTLEQRICRRRRVGDISGHMIPAAYADYVRTGFERDIEAVLYHNAVDLVTLLDLAMRLPTQRRR